MATKASKWHNWTGDPEYAAYRRGLLRDSKVRAAHGGRLSAKLKAALYAEVEAEITEVKRLRAQGVPITEIKRLGEQGLLLPSMSRVQ